MDKVKFIPGERVIVNLNTEARILREYCKGMYEVRLWDDSRHVGDICVDALDIIKTE